MNASIPSSGTIKPAWFTAILQHAGIDAEVQTFRAARIGTGQIGDSMRFELNYRNAPIGAPRTLVGKFPSAGKQSRQLGVTGGNYLREVNFYNQLAPSAQIRVPKLYFAKVDPETSDFVLILEDLSPARQGDQLEGVTIEQATIAMEEAAKLHASHWADNDVLGLPWLLGRSSSSPRTLEKFVRSTWRRFHEGYGDRVTADAERVGERLSERFDRYQAIDGPKCLVHTDFRPDNMMFATDRGGYPMTTLDWQTVGSGMGATDIGYFLGGAITAEQRRAHGDTLVHHYLESLKQLGVCRYGRSEFNVGFACGGMQLFWTAFYCAVNVTHTERGDAMFLRMLNGAAAQIIDSDALDLLD